MKKAVFDKNTAFFGYRLINRRPSFALQATEGRQKTEISAISDLGFWILPAGLWAGADLSDFHPATRNAQPVTRDLKPTTSHLIRVSSIQNPASSTHFPTILL